MGDFAEDMFVFVSELTSALEITITGVTSWNDIAPLLRECHRDAQTLLDIERLLR